MIRYVFQLPALNLILFISVLLASSCGKDAEIVHPNISGTWTRYSGGGVYKWSITIDNSSGSSFSYCEVCIYRMCDCPESGKGKARINKNNNLIIDGKRWHIDEFPQSSGADPATYSPQWRMMLDGEYYYK